MPKLLSHPFTTIDIILLYMDGSDQKLLPTFCHYTNNKKNDPTSALFIIKS